MINVTKSFLPPLEEYNVYLKEIWKMNWLTNDGPFVRQLEEKLRDKLKTNRLFYVANGTSALRVSIKALELEGEIITTAFSYVATTTAIIAENCIPIFCDIDPETLTIDPEKIEELIGDKTSAILATHVYGNPCNIERIEKIAEQHNIKVIYDAAACFNVKYQSKSLYAYGDLSIASFHATKIFHTVEGGAIFCNTAGLEDKIDLYRAFGHRGEEAESYIYAGINAKNSEFHAAMGLCNLKYIDDVIAARQKITSFYDNELRQLPIKMPAIRGNTDSNYAYYPVIFSNEAKMHEVNKALEEEEIYPRRYFYPALNTLKYVRYASCPIAEEIAKKILCLPLYYDLAVEDQQRICRIISGCF
ncbi:MAG: aminotransferase DegT [Bacteroidetes bacterium]|nr:MAG: aminotransferase DegT [Bacteroidota bacterium]